MGVSQTSVVSIVQTCADSDNHPPLYYLLLHFWMLPFGQSEVAVRALSACLRVISVLLIYKVGSELFNRKLGMTASFLMAISNFAIYASQEARSYGLLLLLTLLSFLLFIKILRTDKPNKIHVIVYTITNILLCYTHLFGVLTVGAQVFYFLLFRRRYAKARLIFWGTQAVTLLCFSPWIYVLLTSTFQGAIHGLDWIPEASLIEIAHSLGKLGGAAYMWMPLGVLFMLILFALCLAGIFCPAKSREQQASDQHPQSSRSLKLWHLVAEPRTALLLLWFFSPTLISLIISLTIRPVFIARYLIEVTPALYLLTARGIENISSLVNTRIARKNAAQFMLILLVTLISASGLYTYYAHPNKEQWREATNLIEQEMKPGDAIVLYPDYLRHAFDYYYKDNLKIPVISHEVIENEEPISGKDRLWIVATTYESSEATSLELKNKVLARYGSDSLTLQEEFQWLVVYLFDITKY